jgi:hypothetical protein
MPYKDKEAQKAYLKKYEEIRREERRKRRREVRLERRAEELKEQERARRKMGKPQRPEGGKALRKVKVPKVRRYVFIEDRVYFNRDIGFTRDEIDRVMKAWAEWEELEEKAVKKRRA